MDIVWPVTTLECADAMTDDEATQYTGMAVDWLRAATGNSLGLGSIVMRPCAVTPPPKPASTFWGRTPPRLPRWGVMDLGSLYGYETVGCGQCSGVCDCDMPGLQLPGPVHSVTQVRIDGAVFTDWVLLGNTLIRTDDEAWPEHQNLLIPATQPDTWEVTYLRGRAVPYGGQIAASVLTCEMWRAATNASKCRLPQGLQSLTRQGVSMTTALAATPDPNSLVTGIWLIDSWVTSTRLRSSVMSPDYGYRKSPPPPAAFGGEFG